MVRRDCDLCKANWVFIEEKGSKWEVVEATLPNPQNKVTPNQWKESK